MKCTKKKGVIAPNSQTFTNSSCAHEVYILLPNSRTFIVNFSHGSHCGYLRISFGAINNRGNDVWKNNQAAVEGRRNSGDERS